MLPKKMEEALNKQINAEMYSAYLYLSMAAWLQGENLPGMASWIQAQAEEEVVHAMKIYNYIGDRGGRVQLTAIEGPETEWETPLAIFEGAYEHEQLVTGLINGLVAVAREERDNATEFFLQWFVNEQVEEEATADQIVQDLRRMEGHKQGTFMIDRELGQRRPTSAALADGAQE